MIRLGLIGYPVEHSFSPKIHAAALKAFGLDGKYSLFPIHPDDKQGLKDLLDHLRSREISGLNVTIPHKQNVIEFLDELTSTAKTIGAVNVVYMLDDKLIGDNTDAPGFLADLRYFLDEQSKTPRHKCAVVLGAGGSARAVVYALLSDGWTITIVARRLEQAQELSNSFENKDIEFKGSVSNIDLSKVNLIVNTTPVGMTPNTNQSPLPENFSLPRHVAIYDLVYNPRETKLVRDARSQGLQATTGIGMLIEQAILAFEIWTGCNPPRDILYTSAVE